jgi:transcriptional regulator with XRE-family HTH domain
MNETGRMLREARLERGWSQARLGRTTGVAQSVISAYESGTREPAVAAMRKLARAMDLDLALVPRRDRGPDPHESARQLEHVLELSEAMHHSPRRTALRYPVLGRSA